MRRRSARTAARSAASRIATTGNSHGEKDPKSAASTAGRAKIRRPYGTVERQQDCSVQPNPALEPGNFQSWNWPVITEWHRPPSTTRSPALRQCSNAGARTGLKGRERIRAEPVGPERNQRGVGGAGDRVLVDPESARENPAGDGMLAPPARSRSPADQIGGAPQNPVGPPRTAASSFSRTMALRLPPSLMNSGAPGVPSASATPAAPRTRKRRLGRSSCEQLAVPRRPSESPSGSRSGPICRTAGHGPPPASHGRTARLRTVGVNQRRS